MVNLLSVESIVGKLVSLPFLVMLEPSRQFIDFGSLVSMHCSVLFVNTLSLANPAALVKCIYSVYSP